MNLIPGYSQKRDGLFSIIEIEDSAAGSQKLHLSTIDPSIDFNHTSLKFVIIQYVFRMDDSK
ncbi:hypothetical protein HOF92_08760 [bacterium]|nr:hypothetical protein [bacterium]